MSSYLVSALSLSLDVLTCLLVVVFLSRRYLHSFVLKRLTFVLLGCLQSLLRWLPELLWRLLVPLLPAPAHTFRGVGRPSYVEKGRSRRDTFCDYCSRPGHPESDCCQK